MSYTVPVTIPSTSVSSSLTGFPVYIDMSTLPAGFWTALVYPSGADIRVKNNSNAVIPFDIVSIDAVAKTGSLFCKTALSSSVDTTVSVICGDPALSALPVTDTNGRNAVWSDYHRVFCFDANGGADRTGNGAAPAKAATIAELYSWSNPTISAELSSHEGLAWDGTYFYSTDVNHIYKWDASFSLIATNSNPVGDVGNSTNHLGDLVAVAGVLYIVVENYTNITTFSHQRIAKFNASDLSFISSVDVSAQGAEVAGITYVPEDSTFYVCSYADGSKLWKYDTSLSYLGSVSLSATITQCQGLTYVNGNFFAVQDDTATVLNKGIVVIHKDGTVVSELFTPVPTASGDYEGITNDGVNLWLLYSATGAGQGKAYKLVPLSVEAGGGVRGDSGGNVLVASGLSLMQTFTLGASAKITSYAASHDLVSYTTLSSTTNADRVTVAYRQSTNQVGVWDATNTWLFASSTPSVGTLFRVHAVYNGTTNRKIYLNGGTPVTSGAITAKPPTGSALYIGTTDAQYSEKMYGDVGFVYLRSGALSDAWLAAESVNLHTPASFYSVGTGVSSSTVRAIIVVSM